MTRFFMVLMAAFCAIAAKGQTDSLTMSERNHELREVVVNADVARTSAEKSTFLPTRRQRNAATDAVALLQHMMIPQLSIDPVTEAVRTITNEDVAIFIDFMPATKEDLQGMNTQDVRRVEIYDFPKDVRFQNKPHVVNFVMQRYEIGGYTKLSTTDMLLSGSDFQAGGSVYSKLVSKVWTFDANVTDVFSNTAHNGAKTEAIFRLPAQTISRNELSENGKSRLHKPSASLRATYNSEKIQLANRFEILCEDRPKRDQTGNVSYEPSLFNSAVSESHNTSKSLTPKFQGDWNFTLPKNWALSITPELMFMDNKTSRLYREGDFQPIENRVKEKMFYSTWQALLSKTFAQKHTLSLIHYGDTYNSRMDYSGSTNADCEVGILSLGQGARYSFSTPKFRFSSYFVYCYNRKNMDGVKQENWFPAANLSASFSPNEKNSLSFQFLLVNQQADGAKSNPTVMKENELMYYSGNASLENYSPTVFVLQYSWMPSNLFTASAYAQTIFNKNYFANTYQLCNDGAALIRKMENVGDLNQTVLGASLTLRLLDNKLQINASPSVNIFNTSGEYDTRKSLFNLTAWASYYLGSYYLQAYAKTAERDYDATENAWRTTRPHFYLRAGWGNATWKANVTVSNPFRNHWRTTRSEISTPLYTLASQAFGATSHQRINFTVSYTFNYGKKVKQGNELDAATGGQSSIL